MNPSAIALWIASSAFGTFLAYIIGYTQALNAASAYMPKDIFQGGKGFSLNAPLLFGSALAAAAALSVLILFCVSLFTVKHRFLSQPHGLALLFVAPALAVFLLFRLHSA